MITIKKQHNIDDPKFIELLNKFNNVVRYSYNRNEKGKLRDWAVVLGIPIKTESGAEMFKYYYEKRFDEVEKHCLEDLEVTKKLFEHVDACGLLSNGNIR